MAGVFNRRRIMALFGAGGAGAASLALGAQVQDKADLPAKRGTVEDLRAAFDEIPYTDVHCHFFAADPAPLTQRLYVAEISLGVWLLNAYFPQAWPAWKAGTDADRARINKETHIEKYLDEAVFQMNTTTFMDYHTKEMAKFFKCKPTLQDVVGARNDYMKRSPWGYVSDLFASANIQDLFIQSDSGAEFSKKFTGGLGAGYNIVPSANMDETRKGLPKCRIFHVAWQGVDLNVDLTLDQLIKTQADYLRNEVKQYGAVAFKSGVAKQVGMDIQPMTHEDGEKAWQAFRRLSAEERKKLDERTGLPNEQYKKLVQYMVWRSLEVCLELDVPMHFHAGDGEYQDRLTGHYPYQLENVIRYPVEFPQKPVQIVLLHSGYPQVGEAAYLSHIFPNAWFSMCLMNPLVNRGLHERMLEVFEVAPMAKVLMGSDSYLLPEFNYLAAKWGRRYLASALAVFVDEGILTRDEAIHRARMILLENVHRLHKTNPVNNGSLQRIA